MAKPPRTPIGAIGDALPDFEREGREPLRVVGLRDPLKGCPMLVQLHPGAEKTEVNPGQWRAAGFYDHSTGLPQGCPVTPLGKDGQTFWFLDTMGGVVGIEAGSSGKGPIEALFAGRTGWLEWAWPRWSKMPPEQEGGKATFKVIGWQAEEARQALFNACAWQGHFSLDDQVRGRGAWRGVDDRLIYHAGDEVWIDGKWRPCGMHGDYIYPARDSVRRPARRPQPAGSDSAGDQLLDLLRTFNWDRGELDARLMLGWIMTAKMGGALYRRPVIFVTGGEGAGKTTLQVLARYVMGGALIKTSNTTAAGIYQRLREDSVAILVDELEGSSDPRMAQKILELARVAYSGDSLNRGGDKGVAREFKLQSSFMGSAVSMPALHAQDASRMAVLMMRELEQAGNGLKADSAELETIGRALLRRIFDHWSEWDGLVEIFRSAMIEAGHTARAGDTFAPLAAGAHLAISDAAPTFDELAQWMTWLDPRELDEVAGREKTWRRCLAHLLDVQPQAFASPSCAFKSIGQVIDAFREARLDVSGVDEYLGKIGVAFSWPRDTWPKDYATGRLFVPATHPAVQALFEGTQWAGQPAAPGPWNGVLKQMPKHLWKKGVSEKGLDTVKWGLYINLFDALEAMK